MNRSGSTPASRQDSEIVVIPKLKNKLAVLKQTFASIAFGRVRVISRDFSISRQAAKLSFRRARSRPGQQLVADLLPLVEPRRPTPRSGTYAPLPQDLAQERPRPLVLRVAEEFFRRRLLDDPALVHEDHPVGDACANPSRG